MRTPSQASSPWIELAGGEACTGAAVVRHSPEHRTIAVALLRTAEHGVNQRGHAKGQ